MGVGGHFHHRYVAGNHHHRYAAFAHGSIERAKQHFRHLLRMRNQLDIIAAFAKQFLRMGFLKIAQAHFGRGNMRSNRQHRHMIALAIEKAVD